MKFEYDIITFFQANATPGWLAFFQTVTLLGSYLGLLITFIIVFLKNKKLTIPLVLVFIVGSAINFGLKHIIARSRPFDTYSDIVNYGNEDGYSMPSGHSLCAGIFTTFLIYTLFISAKSKWTLGLGTFTIILFPLLVALSRMVLGVHYFTDTLMGLCLGSLFAIISILIFNFATGNRRGNFKNRK